MSRSSDQPAAQARPTAAAREESGPEAIKETLESVVIAFILAFVFRAYVVEAFVIPTGSMAPTLMGAHARVTCSQCGYTYTVNWPHTISNNAGDRIPLPLDDAQAVACPMCHWPDVLPKGANPSAGDRILVHKFIYDIRDPRRWDVVVFKNPADPQINFIKRLVGLPGEEIAIVEGNIYVRSINTPPRGAGALTDGGWSIARKTDRLEVQRAVWQPIYHSEYFPLDAGQSPLEPSRLRWDLPWTPWPGGAWRLPGPNTPPGPDRTHYRYDSAQPGALRFDFHGQFAHATQYAYNQKEGPWHEPIEDVRLAVALRPDRPGLGVTLRTEARLDNPANNAQARPQTLAARLDDDGAVTLLRAPSTADGASTVAPPDYQTIKTARTLPPDPSRTTTFELWFVDQHALVWVDGELVLDWAFELDFERVVAPRPPLADKEFPFVAVEVEGSPVTLYNVELDRDIYYSTRMNSRIARGGIHKGPQWSLAVPETQDDPWMYGDPVRLNQAGPGEHRNDEFFCLGDNSPSSSDSRYWDPPHSWIAHRMFDDLDRQGVVPRHLMMGRAFFVYFPAPFRWGHDNPAVFINFGDMRFID